MSSSSILESSKPNSRAETPQLEEENTSTTEVESTETVSFYIPYLILIYNIYIYLDA